MKKFLLFSMFILLGIIGCEKSNLMTELLSFKDSYVGDNSAVGNIIGRLPAHEYLDYFELQTSQEPYEMTINYHPFDEADVELEDGSSSKVSINEILPRNAMIILSLVNNAEIIHFKVGDQDTITFDRATLVDHYGKPLESISEDVYSLQSFINDYHLKK